MAYRILTDTCCDFPLPMYKELALSAVPLTVNFKGESIQQYEEQWLKDLFRGLRDGETASTSAANPQDWQSIMEPVLQNGEDALVLAFSSGLSTTYQSAVIAATELMEKYPERVIRVVDTLCASLGQAMLVYQAVGKKREGKTIDEVYEWAMDYRHRQAHWFTVNDLFHLKRGGRVSAATAVVGTMLKIKPVLHVDEEGHLVSAGKARGRKSALTALVDKLDELGIDPASQQMFICHSHCEEDAKLVAAEVERRYGINNIIISSVGPVIGAHTGVGVVALFFEGTAR
jgi:DegV family protein with EDD domain